MKKLLTIILIFISYSCTDTNDTVANNEMIPGRDVYIAGYISDGQAIQQHATGKMEKELILVLESLKI